MGFVTLACFFFFFFSVVLIYPDSLFSYFTIIILSVMTAVTFPLRLPRLAFAICGWRWQNDLHEIKYSVDACGCVFYQLCCHPLFTEQKRIRTVGNQTSLQDRFIG